MAVNFFNYPLVSPDNEKLEELSVSVSINLLVNILWLRAKKNEGKRYNTEQLEIPHKRIQVISLSQSGKKVILGYDYRHSTWYTDQKCSWKAGDFFKALKPLSETELNQVDVRARRGIEVGQELIVDLFHHFRFSPPFIGMQKSDIKAFCSLPKTFALKGVKKVEGVSVKSISALCQDLLKVNKGLFAGHPHSLLKCGMAELLASQMEAFSALGVRRLYDEVPAEPMYAGFERFNKDPHDNGEYFEKLEKDPYREQRVLIYRAAKKNLIEVWPIDDNAQPADLAERLSLGDNTMIRNIEYFSKNLKEEEKFIVLAGLAHYRVAEGLGIPNVLLNKDMTEEKKEGGKIDLMNRSYWEQTTDEQKKYMYEKAPDFIYDLETGALKSTTLSK